MAQTATSMASLLKDAWTTETLQKQFEDENAPYGKLQTVEGTMIGLQAQVPVHAERSFDITTAGAAGGSLNPATAQQVTQATYGIVQFWKQIALETSALAQATGNRMQSIIAAKDLEIEGAVNSVKHNISRQMVTNGDGIVAACATMGSSGTTIPLVPATSEGQYYGYSALARGWTGTTAAVDIGTTADTDALATGATITGISLNPASPSITIGSSIQTTQGTHFVYIPNPNSATAANPEINGLRLFANDTGAVGGLNPATAGQERWRGTRDSSTTVLSLDLLLSLQRPILQVTGGTMATDMWLSFKQQQNFYSLLQPQVRYANDGALAAGNVDKPVWNNIKPTAFADILDTDVFLFNLKDMIRIDSGFGTTPKWASDLQGANQGMLWSQGTTAFGDGLVTLTQVGIQRRATFSAATALQA